MTIILAKEFHAENARKHQPERYTRRRVYCEHKLTKVKIFFNSITGAARCVNITSGAMYARIKNNIIIDNQQWYYTFEKITIKNKDNVMNKNRIATITEAVDRIVKVYGDSYTLPKINKEYVSLSEDNLTVICPIHGKFISSVSALSARSGCPECGKLRRTISRRTSGLDTKGKAEHSFGELMNLYNFIKCHNTLVNEVAHEDYYEKGVILYDLYLQSLVKYTVVLPSGKHIVIRVKQAAKLIRTTEEHAAAIATEVLIDKITKGRHKVKNTKSHVTTLADVAVIVDKRNDPKLAKKIIKRVHSDSFEFPKFDSEYKTNQSILTGECVMPGHGTFKTTLANISNLKGCPKCVEMLNDLAGKLGNSIKARLELQKIYRTERLRQKQVIEDKRELSLLTQTESDASTDNSDDSVNIGSEPVLSFTDKMIMESTLAHTSNDDKQVSGNPCETVSLISEPMIALISKPFDINNTGFERPETQDDVDDVFSIVERPIKPPVVVDEKEVTRTRNALKLLDLYEKYEALGYELVFKKDDKELVIRLKHS